MIDIQEEMLKFTQGFSYKPKHERYVNMLTAFLIFWRGTTISELSDDKILLTDIDKVARNFLESYIYLGDHD